MYWLQTRLVTQSTQSEKNNNNNKANLVNVEWVYLDSGNQIDFAVAMQTPQYITLQTLNPIRYTYIYYILNWKH